MNHDDIIRYCDVMEGIKRRLAVADRVGRSEGVDLSPDARVELIYLQYRKILEQIAFASLISNREKFSKIFVKFSKYWNAADLLRDLSRVNAHFYPEPVTVETSSDPAVDWHLSGKKDGYLTKGDFLELYGRTGDILHERNPYAGTFDTEWFTDNARPWWKKIVGLLEVHVVHLFGQDEVYVVRLQGDDGRVHHYTLQPDD
jgi:hypothetical protein